MQFQYDVSTFTQFSTPEPPPAPVSETVDLLRQILDVQRQQLALAQASAAAHDFGARWRAFLARWKGDFPDLSESCREILPILERAYGSLVTDLAEHIRQNDPLDNEFAIQEFLDRYGMRLAQLGTILNLVAPLADAGSAEG